MRQILSFRVVLTLGVLLSALLVVFLLLQLSSTAFVVWDRLAQASWGVRLAWGGVFLAVLGGVGWGLWRIWRSGRASKAEISTKQPLTDEQLQTRILRNQQAGAEVDAAQQELAELEQRRLIKRLFVGLFGEVNAGKSTLIKALLPDADTFSSPIAGATRDVQRYLWRDRHGRETLLSDMPGLNEMGETLSELSRDEALRSHVVIYLCDGDLTRDQFAELSGLIELGKPLLIAVNKADRYAPEERAAIIQRIGERLDALPQPPKARYIVATQAGGSEQVTRIDADGVATIEMRPIQPDVRELTATLSRLIDELGDEELERRRDAAVYAIAVRKLDDALMQRRRRLGEALVANYARKGVLGAMAAVAPGTDLIIQGALGFALVRELCKLYEAPLGQVDLKQMLERVEGRVARNISLLLAVAGNVFKAFPGVGTVTGGAMHAVAYGLIFDSLGKALVDVLEANGCVESDQVAARFEENLTVDMERRMKDMAKIALGALAGKRRDDAL
ncbi:GTPase [Magnetofaba australis]|uniref:Putative small GTP-binding protein n=1 Tax=Magnetofaba australis IT-1 TaxID=1434232 RepID=A0A1Y2JZQ6_9PROT|nr:GTPase [Magnetofaba australis]OSM00388.1 putative small GTP-binding protein [Magnetofaba australis IT-1]